jgi:hypothetical protein
MQNLNLPAFVIQIKDVMRTSQYVFLVPIMLPKASQASLKTGTSSAHLTSELYTAFSGARTLEIPSAQNSKTAKIR